MADPTMDPTADQVDATAGQDDTGAGDASGGYCIELRVTANGKMSIGVETLADEQSEEGGQDDSEDYRPVGSLREAMRLITEIVAHAGQMTDFSASESEMSSGYGKGGM